MLEDDVVTFVKNELKKIPKFLSSDYPESLGREREEEVVLDMEEEKERRRIREAFLQISVHYLKKRNQMEVAETLQSSKRIHNVMNILSIFGNEVLKLYLSVCTSRISCSSLLPTETQISSEGEIPVCVPGDFQSGNHDASEPDLH